MANKTLSVEQIMTRGAVEGLTPYQIATLINAKLVAVGLEAIRPQMMYNYDKNGLINGTKKSNAVRPYTIEEAVPFVEKYVAKRIVKEQNKTVTVQEEEIENTECEGQLELIEV